MKKYMKIICALLFIIIIFILSNIVYAGTCPTCNGTGRPPGSSGVMCPNCNGRGFLEESSIGDIVKEGDRFIEVGQQGEAPIKEENIQSLSSTLYNILLALGIIIAFVIGGILAIKFTTGGVAEQADVKTMLAPYIIGCVIIFGAFTIWEIGVNILNETAQTSTDTTDETLPEEQQSSTETSTPTENSGNTVTSENSGNTGNSGTSGTSTSTENNTSIKVKLNKSTLILQKGKTGNLKATVTPSDKEISWSSSNKTVATVNEQGKVTAKNKAGVTTITVKTADGTAQDTCIVIVKADSFSGETELFNTNMRTDNYYASQSLACDGNYFYVYEGIVNSSPEQGRIIKIDMKTNQVVATSELTTKIGHGNGMTYKDGLLYIVNGDIIYKYDAKTLKYDSKKEIDKNVGRITYDEKNDKFYTISSTAISIYDKNLKLEKQVKLSKSYSGSGQDIEFDGEIFYVLTSEGSSSYLYQYDINGTLITKIPYNQNNMEFEGISIVNGKIYMLQNDWNNYQIKIKEVTIK